jgi:hypothetical protein
MRWLFAIGVVAAAAVPCVAQADVASYITAKKARAAIADASGGKVTKCRRHSERAIVCNVRKSGKTFKYEAYRDKRGHVAVKRMAGSGQGAGPGAPLT